MKVKATRCGHWTEKNPDGSIPMECRQCLEQGAQEFIEDLRSGDPQISEDFARKLESAADSALKGAQAMRRHRQVQKPSDN